MDELLEFLRNLFRHSDFVSFWKMGNWTSFHGWLYILSDLMIGGAYFIIPLLIIFYVYRQGGKIYFNSLYVLFAGFILISGATYFVDALMFSIPLYRVSAVMRFATAVISWVTIFYVVKLIPIAFSLRSPRELEEEIDARIAAEMELKVKNERLLEAEGTARLGYWECDIIRKRVELSDMAYNTLGLPVGSVHTYEPLVNSVHPADLRFVQDCILKNLKAKAFREFYFRIVTMQMEIRHVLIKGDVKLNDAGDPVMIKGTVQDVTELRRHMQKIELQNRKLKKIAWVQSHRMRSPVATMLGMVDLFNHDDPSDPINREVLANIELLSRQLDGMIREIDDLTRVKAVSRN